MINVRMFPSFTHVQTAESVQATESMGYSWGVKYVREVFSSPHPPPPPPIQAEGEEEEKKEEAPRKTRIFYAYFHGNIQTVYSSLPRLRVILENIAYALPQGTTLELISYEYPWYTDNSSKEDLTKGEISLFTACVAHDLRKRMKDVEEEGDAKCVLHGYSVGAGFATNIAQEVQVSAIFLEAPFASVRSVLAQYTPAWMLNWVWDDKELEYFPVARILNTGLEDAQVIIFSSPDDEVCGYAYEEFENIPRASMVPMSCSHAGFLNAHGTDLFVHRVSPVIRNLVG